MWSLLVLAVPFAVFPGSDDVSVVKWLAISGFAGLSLFRVRGRGRLNTAALALVAFFALSLLWSPDPRYGALQLANIAVLFVVFYAVANSEADIPWPGFAVIGVLLGLWFPAAHGYFGNENFLSHFLILTVPFLLSRRWWPLAACVVVFIIWRGSAEIWLVVAVGYFWGLWVLIRREAYFWAVLGVLAPFNAFLWVYEPLAASWPPHAVVARAELWINGLALWLDHPFGVGLGGFDHYYPYYDEVHRQFFDGTLLGEHLKLFAGAVHNEWLQLLIVLGPIGVGLAAWFVYSVWPCDWRLRLAMMAVLTISLVNFPLQLPGSALLAAFIAGLCYRQRLQRVSLMAKTSLQTAI